MISQAHLSLSLVEYLPRFAIRIHGSLCPFCQSHSRTVQNGLGGHTWLFVCLYCQVILCQLDFVVLRFWTIGGLLSICHSLCRAFLKLLTRILYLKVDLLIIEKNLVLCSPHIHLPFIVLFTLILITFL